MIQGAKACYDCRHFKAHSEFTIQRKAFDGHSPYCKGCVKVRNARWYQENKDRTRELDRQWRDRNPERHKELRRKRWERWKENNAEQAAESHRAYMRKPERRIARQVWGVLRGRKEGRRWSELLGYSETELRAHLERQFLKGMTWNNYGEWHIDHIVPLVEFQISGPDDPELRRAWALPNLRPLWAKDNLSKNCRRASLL